MVCGAGKSLQKFTKLQNFGRDRRTTGDPIPRKLRRNSNYSEKSRTPIAPWSKSRNLVARWVQVSNCVGRKGDGAKLNRKCKKTQFLHNEFVLNLSHTKIGKFNTGSSNPDLTWSIPRKLRKKSQPADLPSGPPENLRADPRTSREFTSGPPDVLRSL